MKTRNGFVSNSSSSSFIIICDNVEISEVGTLLAKGADIWAYGDQQGSSGECADDIFQLDKKLWDAIKKFHVKDCFQFYQVFDTVCEESSGLVDKEKLPNKFLVKAFRKDYCCCSEANDIKERYAS